MGLFSWLGGKKKNEKPADDLHANDSREAAGGDDGDERGGEKEEPRESVAELTARLESKNGALRVDAARALLDRWRGLDVEAAAALAPRVEALLDDEEPIVRQSGLAAVRLMRKAENLARVQSAVLARLSDPAAPVRTAAIWAAAHLPGDVPRAQVRAQLESQEEPMRFSAACALADKQDAAAIPALAWALEQGHLRQEALTALMALGDAKAVAPIGELFESERLPMFDKTMAAAALARFGDARGTAHLIERIEDTGDDRPIAAEWAGRVKVIEAAPALFALADEEGDPARGAALRALGRLNAEGAWEKLRGLASDAKAAEDLRMDAAEGIAELGTQEARELLKVLARATDELGALCGELLMELAVADAKLIGTPTNPAATPEATAPAAPISDAATAPDANAKS